MQFSDIRFILAEIQYYIQQKSLNCLKFLVLGGAGSIGQAVTKEIFKPDYDHVLLTVQITAFKL